MEEIKLHGPPNASPQPGIRYVFKDPQPAPVATLQDRLISGDLDRASEVLDEAEAAIVLAERVA